MALVEGAGHAVAVGWSVEQGALYLSSQTFIIKYFYEYRVHLLQSRPQPKPQSEIDEDHVQHVKLLSPFQFRRTRATGTAVREPRPQTPLRVPTLSSDWGTGRTVLHTPFALRAA